MRVLLPRPVDEREPTGEPDLHSFYATDWIGATPAVRADFVSSIDGAASALGRSEGLQTPGDNRVFQALRDLADVVLVGARTAEVEGYRPVELEAERVATRARFGLGPELPTAVLSRALSFDLDVPLYTDAPSASRTVVLTTEAADPDRRARLERTCDVVLCGREELDLPAAVEALHERGFARIVFEGGPSVQSAMLAAGTVDELCLSLTPKLVGPGPSRIVAGDEWPDLVPDARLVGLLEDEGSLFARYHLR